MSFPTEHEGCAAFLRAKYAEIGIDAHVTEVPPLIATAYDQRPFICPHNVRLYHAPTSEQIAAWARDGVA